MSTCTHFSKATLLVALIFLGRLNTGAAPTTMDFKQLDDQLRQTITNVHSSDHDLLEAISHLGRLTERPAFWTQIADSTNYPTAHRTRCVFALFRRHAQGEVDMYSLSRCIEPAKWLEESTITKLDPDLLPPVSTRFPVDVNDGDSVFEITVLNSGASIYIRFKGEVTLEKFTSQLKRGEGNHLVVKEEEPLIIAQMGYDDDYEDWYHGNY